MTSRQKWFSIVLFLTLASLLLAACERPLPGGYNDPDAGTDTTAPEVPQTVPEVDSEAYPVEPVPAAPAGELPEAYPAEGIVPAEGYPAGEQDVPVEEATAEGEAAPEDQGAAEEGAPEAEQAEAETEAPSPEGDASQAEEAGTESAETPGTHTVAAGENLYRIGLLYGVSWLDLAEANNIVDPASLTVGQVLIIPDPDDLAAETAEPAGDTEDSETMAETPEGAAETEDAAEAEEVELPTTYVVQAGDNLFRIGLNFGVDWTEIVAANDIVNNSIYPGQELIIPAPVEGEADAADTSPEREAPAETEAVDEDGAATETPAPGEAEDVSYVVQEGDTIYSVAFQNGIPWTTLVEANGLEAPYTLEVGQTLIIPAAGG